MLSSLWAEPRKRLRGGWRQRQAQEDGDADNPAPLSHLAAGLLRDWSDGLISSAKLQEHMGNAVRDGMRHPMILRLANVGVGQAAQLITIPNPA